LNFNMARTIGPAIGGWIIATYDASTALWVVVACSLPMQLVLPQIAPRAPKARAEESGVIAGLRAGLQTAWTDRFIRRVLILTGAFSLGARGILELLPKIADGLFERGAAGLGTLTSAAGFGALIAAALVALLPKAPPRQIPVAGWIALIASVALTLLVAHSGLWPLTLAATALLGATGTLVGVTMQIAVQTVLEDRTRGRLMSLWAMTGIGGAALGALLIGGLADAVGLGPATLLMYGTLGALLLLNRARL
ncbi:MAG: MFS transporter, partial [Pseudomonadota bacterium]